MSLVGFYNTHMAGEAADFRFVALKEILMPLLSGSTVADIGCGTGALARDLALSGYTVLGVEPDSRLHALAERLRQASPADYTLVNAPVESLKAGALSAYRNFLLIDVLEHQEDDQALLRSLHDLMPSGSQLLCLLPALESLHGVRDRSVGHFRRYSRSAAEDIFSRVPFRQLDVRYWNLIGVPAYWFFESMLGQSIPEGFRMGRGSLWHRTINQALLLWFRSVENRIRPPSGLSLLIRAVK